VKITVVLGPFSHLPPTGTGAVEKRWLAMARYLAEREHSVLLLAKRGPAKLGLPQEKGGNLQFTPIPGFAPASGLMQHMIKDLIYSIRAVRSIPKNTEILVTNTFWLPLLAGWFSKHKVYVDVSRFPKGQMALYKGAARLRVPSRALAEAVHRQSPEMARRVRIIPNPLPFPLPELKATEREKMILFVGRLHPEKGIDLLIRSFLKCVQKQHPAWKLCLVGPWDKKHGGGGETYYQHLRGLARGAEENIEFAGRVVSHQSLAQFYSRAGIFAYPSLAERGESFGLAPLEAMSYGLPVVVSNLDCFADFITHGQNGLVFDHRAKDAERSLGEVLEKCLGSAELRSNLGNAAARKAGEFELEKVAGMFLEDFHQLVNSGTACQARGEGAGVA